MSRIAHFEALAERLVEGTFARLFAGYLHPLEVATHLARAMEDSCVHGPDGTLLAPTHYRVFIHPQDFGALIVSQPMLADELARYLSELARQAGLLVTSPPVVSVEPLLEVASHSVHVTARWQPPVEEEQAETRQLAQSELDALQQAVQEEPRGRPFLIVGNGRRHVALTASVVSIGRALDNDVILEDSRVSRHHAQLRCRYGRYVLYDLGSAGGTAINGYPVQECVLQPGDVISFAGSEVIYGEDSPVPPPGAGPGDTPAQAERATA